MTPDVVSLVIAAVLVVVAAFLVAGETAIARVSRRASTSCSTRGSAARRPLRPLLDDRARYVNVLLFLHMLFFVAAIVLVTRAFLDMLAGPIWWPMLASCS